MLTTLQNFRGRTRRAAEGHASGLQPDLRPRARRSPRPCGSPGREPVVCTS
ncbi:MAG: hypothetical protein MZU79_02290 [Anaerotruncus sp.]|nr:hypothetical protein [Anaerotruncus sp.]